MVDDTWLLWQDNLRCRTKWWNSGGLWGGPSRLLPPPHPLWAMGNSPDKLRHPRSDTYSAQQVLLNKQQLWCGEAYLDCYRATDWHHHSRSCSLMTRGPNLADTVSTSQLQLSGTRFQLISAQPPFLVDSSELGWRPTSSTWRSTQTASENFCWRVYWLTYLLTY